MAKKLKELIVVPRLNDYTHPSVHRPPPVFMGYNFDIRFSYTINKNKCNRFRRFVKWLYKFMDKNDYDEYKVCRVLKYGTDMYDKEELIDALTDMIKQHCEERGPEDNPHYFSNILSADARAMRVLAR